MIKVKITAPYSRYYGQIGTIESVNDITLTDFIGPDLVRVLMPSGLKLTFNSYEFEGDTRLDKEAFWHLLRQVRAESVV